MPLPEDLQKAQDEQIKEAEKFSFDVDRFEKDIERGDRISVILRTHLYIEHVLIHSLSEALTDAKAIDLRRLNFPAKLDLCIAMGLLPSSWRNVVGRINEMRNHVAHKLDFEFDPAASRELIVGLPPWMRKIIFDDAKLASNKPEEVPIELIFKVVVLYLDIGRQKAKVERIMARSAEEHLRRTLERARRV